MDDREHTVQFLMGRLRLEVLGLTFLVMGGCVAQPGANLSAPTQPITAHVSIPAEANGCGDDAFSLPALEWQGGTTFGSPKYPALIGPNDEVLAEPPLQLKDGMSAIVPIGAEVQAVVLDERGSEDAAGNVEPSLLVLLSDQKLLPGDNIDDFLGRGPAVVLHEFPTRGQDASLVLASVGTRGSRVSLGQAEAALIHGDPTGPKDLRTWDLYWSDGVRDYSVISTLTAEEVVALGRSMMCA